MNKRKEKERVEYMQTYEIEEEFHRLRAKDNLSDEQTTRYWDLEEELEIRKNRRKK